MNTDRRLLYGYSPETYADRLDRQRSIADMPDNENGWSTSGSGFSQSMEESYLKRLLAANDQLEPDDPQSPIQRNNQPMGTYMKIGWKDDDGNYTRSDSYNRALDSPDTGGAFKDALLAMDGDAKQDWLNNNHGGRGLGYMGQNAYQSNPNMAERRAAVQANARRIRGMS